MRSWLFALASLTVAYALLGGAVTPPADLFLAPTLNYHRLVEWSGGIPVQIPRALTAVGMAVAMWLGSQSPAAKARPEEIPFHYALGLAGAILVLVTSNAAERPWTVSSIAPTPPYIRPRTRRPESGLCAPEWSCCQSEVERYRH